MNTLKIIELNKNLMNLKIYTVYSIRKYALREDTTFFSNLVFNARSAEHILKYTKTMLALNNKTIYDYLKDKYNL